MAIIHGADRGARPQSWEEVARVTETTTQPVADAVADRPSVSLRTRGRWLRWGLMSGWGPGLVVMLAATDAG